MAYMTITSTTDSVSIDNGVYSGGTSIFGTIPKKATFPKSTFLRISLPVAEDMVEIIFKDMTTVTYLSYDGATGTRKVDSVDGVAPSSNSDLYDKLSALLG